MSTTLLIYFAVFVVSFIALAKSGGVLVKLTSKIASFLEVSEFLFAFVIVGIATSLPEIFVGISAAVSGSSVLAFGNVVGSNIIYQTLIIGLIVLLAGRILLLGYKDVFQKKNIYIFGITLMPFILMADLQLSRREGLVMVLVFVLFVASLIRRSRRFKREYHLEEETEKTHSVKEFLKNISYLILGFIVLYFSAQGVVKSATVIASEFNVSIAFMSIFVVAFGTNLPEISFSIQAALKGKKDIILGNMMGSLAVNSAIALGLAAVIQPVVIKNAGLFYASAFFSIFSLLMLLLFTRIRNNIVKTEGIILIVIYALFVVTAFVLR